MDYNYAETDISPQEMYKKGRSQVLGFGADLMLTSLAVALVWALALVLFGREISIQFCTLMSALGLGVLVGAVILIFKPACCRQLMVICGVLSVPVMAVCMVLTALGWGFFDFSDQAEKGFVLVYFLQVLVINIIALIVMLGCAAAYAKVYIMGYIDLFEAKEAAVYIDRKRNKISE